MNKNIAMDLVGQRFGRLLVIKRIPNIKGRVTFNCLCDCKNECNVNSSSLKAGLTKSCGCLHKESVTKDLSGMTFGSWSVLSKVDKRFHGGLLWLCECICGTKKNVASNLLLMGKSTQCMKCKHNASKKQICISGHDTEVWGRDKNGKCRGCIKDLNLRKNYGISLEEFIKIYEFQEGRCAICGKSLGSYIPGSPGWGKGNHMEVDHDHRKGKRVSVRGILCGGRWQGCNRKLGKVDDIKWLTYNTIY